MGRVTLIRHARRACHLPPGEGKNTEYFASPYDRKVTAAYIFLGSQKVESPCLPLGEGVARQRRVTDEGHPSRFHSFPSDSRPLNSNLKDRLNSYIWVYRSVKSRGRGGACSSRNLQKHKITKAFLCGGRGKPLPYPISKQTAKQQFEKMFLKSPFMNTQTAECSK